jgi:hypothetical protein
MQKADWLAYAAGALLGEPQRARVSTVSVTRSPRGTRVTIHYLPEQGSDGPETTVLYTPAELLPLVQQAEQQVDTAVVVTAGEDLWLVDGELTRALVTDRLSGQGLPGASRTRPTILRKGTRWKVTPWHPDAGPSTQIA